MQVQVNGDPKRLDNGATLQHLLKQLQLSGRIAVELNGKIIPRGRFGETRLSDGDRLEIVQAIGGG